MWVFVGAWAYVCVEPPALQHTDQQPPKPTTQQGDVRHAILTLQLQLALAPRSASAAAATAKAKGGKGGKGKGSKTGGMGGGGPSVVAASLGAGGREDKDRYLSGLHAIGKIIYAKRALRCRWSWWCS